MNINLRIEVIMLLVKVIRIGNITWVTGQNKLKRYTILNFKFIRQYTNVKWFTLM